jgi:hypothetical protein
VISNGNTAIVVHPMIAARVSNNSGIIRSGSDGPGGIGVMTELSMWRPRQTARPDHTAETLERETIALILLSMIAISHRAV